MTGLINYSYRKKRNCGTCPYIEETGSTDNGWCPIRDRCVDIMSPPCVCYPNGVEGDLT